MKRERIGCNRGERRGVIEGHERRGKGKEREEKRIKGVYGR